MANISLNVGATSVNASLMTPTNIKDGSVTTAKIADGAVTTVKLADGSVTTEKVNNDLKSAFNTLIKKQFSYDDVLLELGGLSSSNGSELSNTARERTSFFYALAGGVISSVNSQQFVVCRYSQADVSTFISGRGLSTNDYTIPADGYYRIAITSNGAQYGRNNEFNNIIVDAQILKNPKLRKIKYGEDELCAYKAIGADGLSFTSNTYACTSYLPCVGTDRLSITMAKNSGASTDFGLAFYAKDKTMLQFISGKTEALSNRYTTYDVPNGAYFLRATFFANNSIYTREKFHVEFMTEKIGDKMPYQNGYFFFSQSVNQAVNEYWSDTAQTELDYTPNYTTGVIALPSSYSADGDPVPVIMYFHGYNHYVYMDAWGNTDNFRTQKQHWLDAGFAVIDCNGGRDNNMVGGYTSGGSRQYCNGYKKCLEYVKAHYNVQPQIFVSGGSSGGIAAINYCLWYDEDVRAVCLLSPWTDLYTLSWEQGITDTIKEYLGMGDTYEVDKAIGFDPALRMVTIGTKKYLFGWNKPTKFLIGSTELQTGIYGCLLPFVTALRNAGETANLRILDDATHSEVVSGGVSYIDTEVANWFKSI